MTQTPPPGAPRRRSVAVGLALAAGLAIAGAVYGIAGWQGNAGAAECTRAAALAKHIAPLAQGEVAAFQVADHPLKVPDLAMQDATGQERHLSEWRGRTVLLNLWATWCIPCRQEMPALNELESKLGGRNFEVVAVNIDTRDPQKPRNFLQEIGVTRLAYYADPSAKIFQHLKLIGRAFGMPTTMLVDAAGCEIGTMAGPAAWASEDGTNLVTAALRG